jgi:hypothetical protein
MFIVSPEKRHYSVHCNSKKTLFRRLTTRRTRSTLQIEIPPFSTGVFRVTYRHIAIICTGAAGVWSGSARPAYTCDGDDVSMTSQYPRIEKADFILAVAEKSANPPE